MLGLAIYINLDAEKGEEKAFNLPSQAPNVNLVSEKHSLPCNTWFVSIICLAVHCYIHADIVSCLSVMLIYNVYR